MVRVIRRLDRAIERTTQARAQSGSGFLVVGYFCMTDMGVFRGSVCEIW